MTSAYASTTNLCDPMCALALGYDPARLAVHGHGCWLGSPGMDKHLGTHS